MFTPTLAYPFLNWDDMEVFVRNDALRTPRLVAWAFTTRYMEHYQPLAWLTWGAVERTVGLTAASAHAVNVVLHAACAALVYLLVHRHAPVWPALGATLFWAIHPLRVEVVAWASAMPYSLALLVALLSMLAWLDGRPWTAVALFAASLLVRPIAIALPIVWMVIGQAGPAKAGPYDRPMSRSAAPAEGGPHSRMWRPAFVWGPALAGPAFVWRPALAGLTIAIVVALAESSARLTASFAEFGVGPRLTLAAAAPWRYLWRTIVPIDLTPLDPLALTPRTDVVAIVAGIAATAAVSAAAWRWRHRHPVLAASWLAYLALLAPAMGLLPSGLQATADRYTYVPAVAISVAIAALLARRESIPAGAAGFSRTIAGGGAAAAIALFAVLTWQQTRHWRDSIALWTHAVEIDAGNDVALYNLAAALNDAGRPVEALARYEEVLAVVPNHGGARLNRDLIRARRLEEEGNRLAAAGSLAAAASQYAEAVRLDPRRTHSHAALGMALTNLGRTREAQPHLRTAIDQGVNDPAVPNALAFGLAQAGDREGALAVLRAAQRRFPSDPNVRRNLAMLEK